MCSIAPFKMRPLLTKISWFKIGLLEKNYPSKVLNDLIIAASFHSTIDPLDLKFLSITSKYL
ncbi:unnamed protein product, partial [Vitis vinifera]|uniref:Uncharacterized protein n=1 Tax=Vitis vinifera TaxID=29760 RepID=D7TEV1_VITVI